MDEHLHDDIIDEIRAQCTKIEGVIATEKCKVRKMGMHYIVDLHVIVQKDLTVFEGHQIAHNVKDTLMNDIPDIADILIHIEPN
jgi:divalent metal cation (Fe/Co/Zn/Cd) transporter